MNDKRDRSVLGDSCGRYTLVRHLATGGMGQIYLASLSGAGGFEKRVAIKRLLPHFTEDSRIVAMFLDEARIAARLSHPNICSVYEVGEGGGSYYIAMEYLQGLTCADLLKRTRAPMAPSLAVGILKQASEGLHAAHELRDEDGVSLDVVHRDVTPSNIFVCTSGVVKLLDFGVARARDTLLKTQAGTLKGKFGYMSPEHLRAEELDRRADIFSLGIVAHELLTGHRLFRRDTMYKTTMAVLEEPIPALDEFGVGPELSGVVARALSRNIEERFSTALQFGEALEQSVGNEAGASELRTYIAATQRGDGPSTATWKAAAAKKTPAPIAKPSSPLPLIEARPVQSWPEVGDGSARSLLWNLAWIAGLGLALMLTGVLAYYLVL